MEKHLIIGGAGFIGSHLAEKLFSQGHRVIVVDNLSTGKKENLPSQITLYDTQKKGTQSIGEIIRREKPDVVYHLAGVINLRRPINDPLFMKSLDFMERTHTILKACHETMVKKIIFVSSGGALYQNATSVPTRESYVPHPVSLYGIANLMIEKYLEMFCQHAALPYAILRLSNVFGPRQWESGVIPSFITNLLDHKKPVIYGNGTQTRDFIYIDDVVEALIVSAARARNTVLNVGSGKEVSLNEAFELAKKMMSVTTVNPEYKKMVSQETQRSALDIKKIKKEIDWKPKVNFKTGLEKTISWFVTSHTQKQ